MSKYIRQRLIPIFQLLSLLCLVASVATVRNSADESSKYTSEKLSTELIHKRTCDHSHRNVLMSSLMNGDVVALDLNTGHKLWQVSTGDKLLSSSISSLEVIYNGISTRLVPSLDGSLFRFHDDAFEPLPFTAETLLSSSFKLAGESSVVVGSKELRTVGLEPSCGMVLYKCSKEGCDSFADPDHSKLDVLTIKHMTHTVRAASIRYGTEKWNFSVGHHEVTYTPASEPNIFTERDSDSCDAETQACPEPSGIPNMKFYVSDGLVTRLYDDKKTESMWKYKFPAPISKSWVLKRGAIHNIDLLDPKYLLLNERIDIETEGESDQPPPSLYIGLYENQVYIQPSEKLRKNVSAIADLYRRGAKIFTSVPKVRWAPYIASTPSRTPSLNYGQTDPTVAPPTGNSLVESQPNALSLFNPNKDYPYDQGFYLTTEVIAGVDIKSDDQANNRTEDEEEEWDGFMDEIENIINVQIVSLWFYWKEVVAISIMAAVAMNFVLYLTRAHRRRLKNKLKCFGSEQDISDVSDVSEDEGATRKKRTSGKGTTVVEQPEPEAETVQAVAVPPPPPPPAPPTPQYQSRYQSDFDHVQCLGKGGFGVVFHARNSLDECDYAIKRVTLPNSDDAKEKVTREVKALAKLDHPNIVRYFQSWFETPPIGWQEEKDKLWESTEKFLPTPMNSGLPLSRQLSRVTETGTESGGSMFIPKLKLDDLNTSASFGFPANHGLDDSVDIVFGSHSETLDQSASISQPFLHYTTVAPVDDSQSDTSDSDGESELYQLDDSGYHKNKMAPVEATGSFGDEVSWDDTQSEVVSKAVTPKHSTTSDHEKKKKNKEPQAKLFLYIQMQLCKRETLRDYLNANTLFRDKSDVLIIFRQICDAVSYIHSQGLIHRDLKPTNIFFSLEDSVKVGDFGLVTALSAFPDEEGGGEGLVSGQTPAQQINLTNNVGTQIYMSPEQVAGRMYNSKVDIYALGLVYFELSYPFSTMMERVMTLQNIKKHKYPERFVRELPEQHKFVKWMLARDPNKRPSIMEVVDSEIMRGAGELLVLRNRTRTVSRSSSNE